MRIQRLGDLGDAPALLLATADAASRIGLPPPAALMGEWFGSRAVIAPTVVASPMDPRHVFAAAQAPGTGVGGGWIGYLSYPDGGADGMPPRIPEAAGGWADSVLRQDHSGTWWYESLSGAPMPHWVSRALLSPPRQPRCHIAWDIADRDTHRAGVLACLDAIAAGEVYQACVCTRFTGEVSGAPVDFFVEAVTRTAPARAAFIAGPWGAVASLSPELFLRCIGDTVTSSPIKGTLPRHAPPSALRNSAKDVAENIMIVDLVRND